MKIRTQLLLTLLVTAAFAFYFLSSSLRDDVKNRYFQILEDGLAETTTLLSAQISDQLRRNLTRLSREMLQSPIEEALQRNLNAQIFDSEKRQVTLRIYVTNEKGIVIFDSANLANEQDYSSWNDVYLTLRGKYGARSSRDDPRYPNVSVKYVAAPIRLGDKVVGVITAAKPAITLSQVIDSTKAKILITLAIVFAGFLATGIIVTYVITRPIALLTQYVRSLRSGHKKPMPNLGKSEIGELGTEFQLMRQELDGRKYVEQFVQMLTHEFKSPVAGILGATEILEEDIPLAERQRFVENISREARRIGSITQNLLQIAKLENANSIPDPEAIDLGEMLGELVDEFTNRYPNLAFELIGTAKTLPRTSGNYFLLTQCFANLLQNASDFSPQSGIIQIHVVSDVQWIRISVADQGKGIPDFALDKIFEIFYSLARPTTDRKSTGLGLNLVKLIVELHRGEIKIHNRTERGVEAIVLLPAASSEIP